jgi:ATP-dependent protease ClpP protease subunit
MGGSFFAQNDKKERDIRKFLQNKFNSKEDWFLKATDAVQYGFADDIICSESKYKNIFQLSKLGV